MRRIRPISEDFLGRSMSNDELSSVLPWLAQGCRNLTIDVLRAIQVDSENAIRRKGEY